MSKLGILNLVMFVLLIILAASIYFAPEEQNDLHSVSALQPLQVEHILLQRKNQQDVRLEKVGQKWMLDYQQQSLPANQWRVGKLLELIQAQSEHRFQSDEMEKFGLLPARAEVHFNDQVLLIGDNDPIQRKRYIANGKEIMLVTDHYYIHLFADVTDYLSLAPLEELQIKDIQVSDYRPDLQGDAKQAWLDNWQHLQALQVKAADDTQSGKTITLLLRDGEKLDLLLQDNILVYPMLKLAYELSDASLSELFPAQ